MNRPVQLSLITAQRRSLPVSTILANEYLHIMFRRCLWFIYYADPLIQAIMHALWMGINLEIQIRFNGVNRI